MNSSTFINSRIGDCRIIELERIAHDNGTIAVAQNSDRLPFAMKRAFYLYDIPSGSSRGGHAHITDHQLIVAVSGAFTVNLTDGHEHCSFYLSQPNEGLYVPPVYGLILNDSLRAAYALHSVRATIRRMTIYVSMTASSISRKNEQG